MRDNIGSSNFSGPYLLQIAKDDVWEKTWDIDLSRPLPSDNDIEKYINASKYKTLAIEILFKKSKESFILGLSFNTGLLTGTLLDFLRTVVEETSHYADFISFVSRLDHKLVGKKYLLEGTPDLIRIGIVNHWFSVGPILLWQKGENKELSQGRLYEKYHFKPEVVKTSLNYQGMSFIYNIKNKSPGLCHWMKSPCSTYNKGVWQLDNMLILRYLQDWQGFKNE